MIRPYEVERLAKVLIDALDAQLLQGVGPEHLGCTTGDEVISAYLTACNTACLAAVMNGADPMVLRKHLQNMRDQLPLVAMKPTHTM